MLNKQEFVAAINLRLKDEDMLKVTKAKISRVKVDDEYRIDEHGVYKTVIKRKQPVEIRLANVPIMVTGVIYNAIKAESMFYNKNYCREQVLLEWVDDGEWKSRFISHTILFSYSKFVKLVGYDVVDDRKMFNYLRDFLNNMDYDGYAEFVRKSNWIKDDDSIFVLGNKIITSRNVINKDTPNVQNWGDNSIYLDTDHMNFDRELKNVYKTCGDSDKWLKMFSSLLDSPNMLIGIYLSLAAPALRFILSAPNPVINYSGPKMIGKTTALRIAASVWGEPHYLIMSSSKTDAKADKIFKANMYLPSYVNETTPINRSNGKRLARSSRRYYNGYLAQGAIFYATRTPITSYSESKGTYLRVIELNGSPFVGFKKSGIENLNALVEDNNGHYGPKAIKWLIDNRDEWSTISDMYRKTVSETGSYFQANDAQLGHKSNSIPLIKVGMYLAAQIGLPEPNCDVMKYICDISIKHLKDQKRFK